MADKLRIPFSCFPKEIQLDFQRKGLKLDLNGNDRTRDSWGFIMNEGNQYVIFTYRSLNNEDFDTVSEILFD